jgi:hypothetical protein
MTNNQDIKKSESKHNITEVISSVNEFIRSRDNLKNNILVNDNTRSELEGFMGGKIDTKPLSEEEITNTNKHYDSSDKVIYASMDSGLKSISSSIAKIPKEDKNNAAKSGKIREIFESILKEKQEHKIGFKATANSTVLNLHDYVTKKMIVPVSMLAAQGIKIVRSHREMDKQIENVPEWDEFYNMEEQVLKTNEMFNETLHEFIKRPEFHVLIPMDYEILYNTIEQYSLINEQLLQFYVQLVEAYNDPNTTIPANPFQAK